MCGAPQSRFSRLISPTSARSSAETFGLPAWLRDRQRQYARNPARCQRMIVSGLTIAIAPRSDDIRAGHSRNVKQFSRRFGQIVITHRAVGGAEIDCLREDLFLSSARPDGLIIKAN